VLLLGGYILAVPYLLGTLGGIHGIGVALHAIDPRLTGSWFTFRELLAVSLAIGLGLAAAPYEISTIYSLQSRKAARQAIGYSFLFQAFIGTGVLLFGLSMRVAFPYLPEPDLATPMLGMSVLPLWLGMLVLMAAVVTFTRTGGAILLTAASAVSHDIYAKLLHRGASEKSKVLMARTAVLVFSVIPVLIALRKLSLVNFVVIYAAKLMVSFFFVPVVVGLNWKRATRAGALAGMIGGAVACLAWSVLGNPRWLGLDPAEAGILASALLFVGVSLVTKPVRKESLAVFFADERSAPPAPPGT
jgi:Na+/proline symporter